MANILRFVILGDDRGGPAFATFTRQVERANKAVDRNNAALGRQAASSKKARGEVTRLDKALDGLKKHSGPALLGPALALAPAIASLGGVAAGAAIGLGGALTAAAGSLAGFGAVAKPVLTDAKKASDAVRKAQDNYSIAIANGTKKATAYKAEQTAIAKAYAGMSPAQIALSRQIGAMADAWGRVKAAQTPVVAGALQPWLKSVTDLTGKLGPVIAKIAPVIKDLGTKFDHLVNSAAFRGFRDFIGSTGAAAVSAGGSTIIDLVKSFMILLPRFDPLIREAVGWISRLGPAVLKWASSKKAADQIQGFLRWFSANGPAVGTFLKNIGGALKALAPGLTSGGALELKVISGFLGFVAKLPPGVAKPLAEVAGAALLLNKMGGGKVISFLVTAAFGGLLKGGGGNVAAAGGAASLWSRLAPGARLIGGVLVISLVLESVLKNPKNEQVLGNTNPKSWWNTWSPFINRFRQNIAGISSAWNTTLAGAKLWGQNITRIVSGAWSNISGGSVLWLRNIARTVTGWWSNISGGTRQWWGNIARTVSGWWGSIRGGSAQWLRNIAGTITGWWGNIRGGAAQWWNSIWQTVISRVITGVRGVGRWVGTLPGTIMRFFAGAGNWLYQAGKNVIQGLWNGLTAVWKNLTGWISGIAAWIKAHKGPVSLDQRLLYPAGHALMSGLLSGLKAGFGPVGSFVGGIASWVLGKIKGAGGKLLGGKIVADTSGFAFPGVTSGALGGDAAANKALARRMFPWPASMWPAFDYLEMREAGYNRFARNPSSGAYGIPQALPPTKMPYAAQAGGGSHAGAQLSWMYGYIRSVYGNPVNAAAHERAFNWYGYGGRFAARQLIGVGDRGRELVAFDRPGRVFSPEQSAAIAGGGGNTYNITVNVPPTASMADAGRIMVQHILAYEKGSGKRWRK